VSEPPEEGGDRYRPEPVEIADVVWLWSRLAAAGGPARSRMPRADDLPLAGPTPAEPTEVGADPRGEGQDPPVRDLPTQRAVDELTPSGEPSPIPAGEVPGADSAGFPTAGELGGGLLDAAGVPGRWAEAGDPVDLKTKVRYLDTPVEPDPLPAVREQAAMARALRPLSQRVPAPRLQVVDEDATAEGMLDESAPFPVLRPGTERRWELVLVVDDSETMAAVWSDAIPGLVAFLQRLGVFRNVTVRYADTDAATTEMTGRADDVHADLTAAGHGRAAGRRAIRPPSGPWLRRSPLDTSTRTALDLLDHSGRRIVWILTDGMGQTWRTGAMAAVLGIWSRHSPVAVVNVLPWHLWKRTGLQVEHVRALGVGGAGDSPRRIWQALDELTETAPDPHTVPVPVLELDPGWIGRWAGLVAAPEPAWAELAAMIVPLWPSDVAPPVRGPAADALSDGSADPDEIMRALLATASPEARRLGTYLAAVPAAQLGSASARLVVDMAQVDRRHLSELFALGLLRVTDPKRVSFDLAAGVREPLLGLGTRSEVDRARRAVVAYSAAVTRGAPDGRGHAGTSAAGRGAHGSPTAAPEASPEDRPLGAGPSSSSEVQPPSRGDRDAADAAPLAEEWAADDSAGNLAMSSAVVGGSSVQPAAWPASQDQPAEGERRDAATGGGVFVGPAVSPGAPQVPAASLVRSPGRLPAVWGNVPPKNPHFTGREELLRLLETRLGEGITTVVPESLHGMGGVGKSQLAIEYVYRHLEDYDVIWWIPAERTVQIANALIELGGRLGLSVGTEANVAVREVVEALRRGNPYSRWLLVFDNAEDPRAVREYFPHGAVGQILVTSRDASWGNVTRPIEVKVFEREESIQLLRSRGGPLSDHDADLVANALGDLPLAVEQATTWRAETGMSAQEYLRLFAEKRTELLGTAPIDYDLPVTAAWNVSLDTLAENSPAALELLQVCSFFAPEPISRQLLSRGYNETISPALDAALRDPVKMSQAIREVNRYALARIDHRTNSIVMHRLVQGVLIARMNDEERERMRRGAHVLLAASDPNDTSQPYWSLYANLLPHALASQAASSPEPRVRRLLVNLTDFLYNWGDHAACAALSRDVYEVWRDQFGEEEQNSQEMALQLGWILYVIGRYREAAEINTRLLDVSSRVHGMDSEWTLRVFGNVIADRRVEGDFEGALDLATQAYEGAKRALGPDDPVTLSAAHNIGATLRLLGRFREAEELDEDTWRRRSQLFGEESDPSLTTRSGLIIDQRELGDYLGAKAAQEVTYAQFGEVFKEPNNPRLLRAGRNLSVALRKAGDHVKALEISREVERRFFNRYGGKHPDSMAAGLCLSIDLRHAGDLNEALEVCEREHARYVEAFGSEHPHTLAASVNLAIINRLIGRVDEACQIDERTVAAFTAKLGQRHPSTLAAAANLASDLYALVRFQEAYEQDEETLRLATETLGEVHPTRLVVAANLAMDLRALDRKDEALRVQAETLRLLDTVLGKDHRATQQAAAWVRCDVDVDPMPL